jgi:hypothetical protein
MLTLDRLIKEPQTINSKFRLNATNRNKNKMGRGTMQVTRPKGQPTTEYCGVSLAL